MWVTYTLMLIKLVMRKRILNLNQSLTREREQWWSEIRVRLIICNGNCQVGGGTFVLIQISGRGGGASECAVSDRKTSVLREVLDIGPVA